jgi:hypothetical protein
MRTCSWWAIVTARITVRTTSHRRRPAQAIVSRHRPGPRRLRERLGPGDVRVWRVRRECPGRGRSLRALGRPMRIRFITDLPRSLIRSGPGPLLIRRSLRIRQAGCGRRYRAGTGPASRTGGSYLRSAAGRGGSPSRPTVPRRARSGRGGPCCPQAGGPAAADSRARKVARHRQVRAVALDQAADDARGIKHALDTDRRGQPGSARPCSVTLGIAPSLAPLGPHGPGPGPANGPVLRLWSGSPAALGSPCRCCFRHEHAYGTR